MAAFEGDFGVVGDDLLVGNEFRAVRVFHTPWATIAAKVVPAPVVPKPPGRPPVEPPAVPGPVLRPGLPPDVAEVVSADGFLHEAVESGQVYIASGIGTVRFVSVDPNDVEGPATAGGTPIPAPA